MRPSDVERVADLCTQLGYPSVAADVARRFDLIAARRDHAVFVAVVDQTPLGPQGRASSAPTDAERRSVGAELAPPPLVLGWVHVCAGMLVLEADPWAEVGGLVVDKDARGRGVGGRLLAAAEDWAREHGYHQMRLRSNVIRDAAHEFYRQRGYEVFKTQLNFRKQL